MNENEWFKAFQPLLLRVINTGYGRQLLNIQPDLPPIQHITKNAIHYYLGEGQWQSKFFIGAHWANIIRQRWPEFKRYARFFYDMPHFFTLLNINGRMVPAHATTTAYPDADAESSTVDGFGQKDGGTFAENRSAATGDAMFDDEAHIIWGITFDDRIHRAIFLFDTSGINDAHSVSATTFQYSCYYKDNDGGTGELHYPTLTACSPASNTALVAGDYDCMTALSTPDEFIPRSYSINAADAGGGTDNNTYTFNATGHAAVNKTGITKLMIRSSFDVDNSAPTTTANRLAIRAADYDTSNNDYYPQLTVTHVASNIEKINGIALADIEKLNGITAASGEKINTITF